MISVFANSWALFAGMFLLMIGNGMQGTLLGLRGAIEGYSALEMSFVMSGYFAGFLGGSRVTPWLIRRVGHVRVFAAFASFVSAVLILYPAITDPYAWIALRVIFGFCFVGIYVTAESWLNNAATNETRGQSLSVYAIVQMAGVVAGQYVILLGDPSGFILFILPSVLVSISVAPILLSISPTPPFDQTKPMSVAQAFRFSPLASVGVFLMGGVFAAQFGMTAVYGTEAGLTTAQVAIFVSVFFAGGLLFQYPIGWLSDRVDRRFLIVTLALLGGASALAALVLSGVFVALLVFGFLIGGFSNPLYPLLIAYMNDYLETDDMASASGALLFINGLGAISGPLLAGWLMDSFGPWAFWAFLGGLLTALAAYGLWRMRQRPAIPVEEAGAYVPLSPNASPVAAEAAQEVYVEAAEAAEAAAEGDARPSVDA